MSRGASAGSSPTRADWSAAWEQARRIPGWLTAEQAQRLFSAAARLAEGERIVEIGSFRGRSTVVLACGAPELVEVVAIDPFLGSDRGPREIDARPALGQTDQQAFAANLERAQVAGRVRHVQRPSAQALDQVPGPVHLLYVDGAHRYRPALGDLEDWGARVPPSGRLLVHDAFSSVGVTLALTRAVIGRSWRYLGRTGSMAEYERADLGARDRGREVLFGAAQLPWFIRNLIVKALLVARLGPLTRLLGHRSGHWPY